MEVAGVAVWRLDCVCAVEGLAHEKGAAMKRKPTNKQVRNAAILRGLGRHKESGEHLLRSEEFEDANRSAGGWKKLEPGFWQREKMIHD